MSRLLLAFVAAGVATSLAARATAAPSSGVLLEYQADPKLSDCPGAPELSRAVVEQLGYDPFVDAAQADYRVKASIERTQNGTAARIDWQNRRGESEGERLLTSAESDCDEIAHALSFAVAVQIQLRAVAAPVPPAPPVPQVDRAPPPSKPAESQQPKRMLVLVGGGALLEHGLVPGWSEGLQVFGAVVARRFSFELSTEATFPTELMLADGSGFSARQLSVKLAPCVNASLSSWCAVGMLGQLHVRGVGLDRVQSPSSLVGGVGARFQLLWPALPWLGTMLHLEALVPLTPRDVLVNRQSAWSMAPVLLSAGLDVAAILR
jgi:hypothetical protein